MRHSAKLNWGMVGGGEGSQIGPAHRIGAALDGRYDFVAGALDVDAKRGRDFATRLGIANDRACGDWREMLAAERNRTDPAQAGISAQFADCGIHALHLASFVANQQPRELTADFVSCLETRELEDDAMVSIRMDGGAIVRF